MNKYRDYEIEKSTISGYGKWMVKLFPTSGERFETLFAPTKTRAIADAEMFMTIGDNREVASRKIDASYQVATNYLDAQGAWGSEAFQILKGAGYNPDAINKALAELYDNGKGALNRFSEIVREVGE